MAKLSAIFLDYERGDGMIDHIILLSLGFLAGFTVAPVLWWLVTRRLE